ncbi:MAG: hypothetical protein ACREJB_19320 [Planctomycetaceae bacterium]
MWKSSAWCRTVGLLVMSAAGCGLTGDLFKPAAGPSPSEVETAHRREYQESRSREAIRWLLANRVDNGLSIRDVNRMLGEQGRREKGDLWLKRNGGQYRATDEAWQWGPDADGRTYYLIFRDGQLVNFDPRQYR